MRILDKEGLKLGLPQLGFFTDDQQTFERLIGLQADMLAGGKLLTNAALVGTYRGHPLGPDERSLTYRLTFGAGDRALTDAEVEAAFAAITGALTHHEGARIRS